MNKIYILIIFLLSLNGIVVAQNNVTNIRIQQQDSVVIVTYDLAAKADIEVFVSFNNGLTFKGPLKEISGAVGKGIAPEKNKMFAWNVVNEFGFIDYPNTIIKLVSYEEREIIVEKEPEPEPQIPIIPIKKPEKSYSFFGFSTGYTAKSMDFASPLSDIMINGIKAGFCFNSTWLKYKEKKQRGSVMQFGLDIGLYMNYYFKTMNKNNITSNFKEWTVSIPFHLEPKIRIAKYSNFFVSTGVNFNIGISPSFYSKYNNSSTAIYDIKGFDFYNNKELGNINNISIPIDVGAGFNFNWFQIRGNYSFYEILSEKKKCSRFEILIAFRLHKGILD